MLETRRGEGGHIDAFNRPAVMTARPKPPEREASREFMQWIIRKRGGSQTPMSRRQSRAVGGRALLKSAPRAASPLAVARPPQLARRVAPAPSGTEASWCLYTNIPSRVEKSRG